MTIHTNNLNLHMYKIGRLLCALFAISDDIFCAHCALFSHPNQEKLVINGRETMTCTCTCNYACALKSVAFSLMSLLNVVRRSFFNCTIYGSYFPIVLVLLPEKSDIIYRYGSMWSAIRSLFERHNSTLKPTTVHINFEVAMHTVLKNAQCTFKTSYN